MDETARNVVEDRGTAARMEEGPSNASQTHELKLEPRAPFRLDLTVWALRRRPHNAVDRWRDATYMRVVSIDDGPPVALAATQCGASDAPHLSVLLEGRRIEPRAELRVRNSLERLLGLGVDLAPFAEMAERDPLLRPLAIRMSGVKPPRFPTVFEALVNGVACQQLSLEVGIHLLNRLTEAHGRPVAGDPSGPRAFPNAEQLASLEPDELRRHGFSLTKARTIIETAQAIVAGDLDLESLQQADDQTVMERLTGLRGIGRWTAEYVMLRGLGRLHIFPGDDVGAHNKLRRFFDIETQLDYDSVEQLVARWHPYAGMVYFHLLLDSLSDAGAVSTA